MPPVLLRVADKDISKFSSRNTFGMMVILPSLAETDRNLVGGLKRMAVRQQDNRSLKGEGSFLLPLAFQRANLEETD